MKRLIVFCALAAAAAPGQVAAQAAARTAEPVGRLFYTPAQRASLDIARTQRARTTLSTEQSVEATPAAQTITYGGMVRRNDGKSTVWINGRPVNEKEPAGGAVIVGRVRADGGVSLQAPQSGRSVNLKPGQSIELLSGAIEESFSRKPVTPPEPKPVAQAKPAAKPASPERAGDERDRGQQRKPEEPMRVLQEATVKSGATLPPQPAAGAGTTPSKNY